MGQWAVYFIRCLWVQPFSHTTPYKVCKYHMVKSTFCLQLYGFHFTLIHCPWNNLYYFDLQKGENFPLPRSASRSNPFLVLDLIAVQSPIVANYSALSVSLFLSSLWHRHTLSNQFSLSFSLSIYLLDTCTHYLSLSLSLITHTHIYKVFLTLLCTLSQSINQFGSIYNK